VCDEEGYVMFVRKNALQVLIPKYGLEGTVYLSKRKESQGLFKFDEEVKIIISSFFSLTVSFLF